VPIYDFTVSQRAGYETVSATNTIIIEGLFSGLLLANESDLNVFIDVDLDLALLRRIQRDITERGRTVESVTEQYIHFVRPAYFKHIENIKSTSDIILKNNSSVDQFIKEAQNIIDFVGLD
jgi:uridine kinase